MTLQKQSEPTMPMGRSLPGFFTSSAAVATVSKPVLAIDDMMACWTVLTGGALRVLACQGLCPRLLATPIPQQAANTQLHNISCTEEACDR